MLSFSVVSSKFICLEGYNNCKCTYIVSPNSSASWEGLFPVVKLTERGTVDIPGFGRLLFGFLSFVESNICCDGNVLEPKWP